MHGSIDTNPTLSPKELQLIQLVGEESFSQRRLAQSAGFSLGMTNILLKKLVAKGYIKVVELNGRTLRYILTPRGFKEKLKRTHNYLRESIRRIRAFQRSLASLLEREMSGAARVVVLGSGEVFEMTCEILEEAGIEFRSVSFDELCRMNGSVEAGRILALSTQPEALPDDWEDQLAGLGRVRLLNVALLANP